MKSIVTALLLTLSINAQAFDVAPITPGQIAGEAVFVALMAADYKQTQQISGFCDGQGPGCTVHETNRLLGRYPSHARVRNYFIASTITHAVIMAALPSEQRKWWIASGITLEAVVVGRNKRLGLHVKF